MNRFVIVIMVIILGSIVYAASDSATFSIKNILKGSPHSPYQLSVKKDAGTFIGSISLMLVAKAVRPNYRNYTIDDLASVSRNDVNGFDRIAIGPTSEKLSEWSYVTNGFAVNALWLLFLGEDARHDVFKIIVMYAEAHAFYPLITLWINPLVARKRPYFYSEEEKDEMRLSTFAQSSFPSGHANYGFCFAVLFGNLFNDYFPGSPWRFVVWPLALGCATSTAYLRFAGHWHFPSDLIAGAATGSLIGWFIPYIHRKKIDSRITIHPVLGEHIGVNAQITFDLWSGK